MMGGDGYWEENKHDLDKEKDNKIVVSLKFIWDHPKKNRENLYEPTFLVGD